MTIRFWFDDRSYRLTHGKAPRGYGAWAFEFEGRAPVLAPSSTFADARRWVKEHIRAEAPDGFSGDVRVKVCA